MRNKTKVPYSINRSDKWNTGLTASIPMYIDYNSTGFNTKSYIRDLHSGSLLVNHNNSYELVATSIIGPNGESVLLPFAAGLGGAVGFTGSLCNLWNTGFTLSFWYYANASSFGSAGAGFNYSIEGDAYSLFQCISSSFQIQHNGVNYSLLSQLIQNKWNHVVWTIEPGISTVYQNGILIDRRTNSLFTLLPQGNYTNYINLIDNGYVYDLRTYNYAWTPDQVKLFHGSKQERLNLFGPKRTVAYHRAINFVNNGINLYTVNIESLNNDTDLYISGQPVPSSGAINLFELGTEQSTGSTNLLISGKETITNTANLYERGIFSGSGNFDLFVRGHIPVNSSIDLYTYGISQASTAVNLFIKTPTGTPFVNSVDLSVRSTTNSGIFDTQDLFVKNTQEYDPRNSVTLMIKGPIGFDSESVTLFVQNQQEIANSINLYTAGPTTISGSGVNLFITTPNAGGDSDGYTPINTAVNLFVARDSECLAGTTNLYIKAPEPVYNSINVFVSGTYNISNSINMTISGSGIPEPLTNSVGFYVRGGV